MMDIADESLVAAYSQLERARSLAADGDFGAGRKAYARVEAQLRRVAESVADGELRQSWACFMAALREEQELTAAWEQECAELAAWAEEQDVLHTPTKRAASSTSSGGRAGSPSQPPRAAAFSVDPRSFAVEELAPRQRGAPPGTSRAQGADPDVWQPPEAPPEAPERLRRRREEAFERQRRDSLTPGTSSAAKRSLSGVKPRVDTGAKRVAGAGGEHRQGPMEALLERYSGPDRDLVQQLGRDILEQVPTVGWDDIAGLEEAKEVLRESVALPLMVQELFSQIPILQPIKGLLLFGPPGTGKTMLAKAVATAGSSGECRTHFINVSSSTLASKYRGESEKLVRFLFEIARAHQPCVVFIDEIDALGGERGAANEHEASRRTKTELLTQIDGIQSGGGGPGAAPAVMLLAATNHPWALDDALRRRLEKRIYIPLPSRADREQLLRLHLRGMRTGPDVDLAQIAAATEGYSGDDIHNLTKRVGESVKRRVMRKGPLDTAADLAAMRAEVEHVLNVGGVERRDFESAMRRSNPSCSSDVVQRHVEWARKYGCT